MLAEVLAATPHVARHWEMVVDISSRRWAESTSRRVDEAVVSFLRYIIVCGLYSYVNEPRVAETLVLLWCGFMSQTNSYDSLKTQLGRLRAWFAARPSKIADPTRSDELEAFLQGMKKTHAGNPKRKRPITPEMLVLMARIVIARGIPEWSIMFFAILIGFFCFLRKSNLCVESNALFDWTKMIRKMDMRVDRSTYVLWVRIRRTKTLQSGSRELWIPIQGYPGHILDIVWWYDTVMGFYPQLGAESHIFSGRHGKDASISALSYAVFVGALKDLVRSIGLDPSLVSGHSLRRGGASFAYYSGVSAEVIKAQGDWRSDCYLIYCVIPPSCLLQTSRQMFDKIFRGNLGGEIWSSTRVSSS